MAEVYDTEFAMGEFNWSGEVQLMEKLKNIKMNTIFDVGANIGEWARMIRATQPDAVIHSFEPVPEVFSRLLTNIPLENMILSPFGLSSTCEIRDMLFDHNNDRLTTPCLDLRRAEPEMRSLVMLSGDDYCKSRKVTSIDFLKIDTEGHEYQVLKGLKQMLESNSIRMIQFEYGYANILTKDLLIDFYKLLTPLGYTLGRLTPEGVDYKDYGLFDEDFKGPNFFAVKSDEVEIIVETQLSASQ